ncbi:MAG: HAMP domain-containing protein [Deltaproteobacteria bacterium]|nr:HAMP domain-containing protein [Deltaproteobacteria bacterium]
MRVFRQWTGFRLRAKLTLLIESLVILIVLVTGIITTMREKESLESELHKRGAALAADLARFTARPLLRPDLTTLRRFVNHSMKQDYVRYVIILDPHGKVVMHSDLAEVGKTYMDSLSTAAVNSKAPGCSHTSLSEKEESLFDIFAPVQVSDVRLGTVRLGYSYLAVEKEIAEAQQQILIIGIVTTIIGGVVAYLLAIFISSPIRRITDATEKVANGDLNTPLTIKRKDEIGTLATSFNKMAQDLGRHRKHLEELVEGRTSELGTANEQLRREIAERKRSEKELKQSRKRLRDLASHLQTIREKEGSRIAREIHDELGQALTALKMDTHWVGQRLSGDQQLLLEKAKSMSKLIDTTIHSVQRISSELRPGLLDDLGLSAAIEWQANEFRSRTNIQCKIISIPEDIILDSDSSTAIFRIFQETLTNIARHANATRVEVMLKQKSGTAELIVHDNGKGITENEISNPRAFGLIGMRERVHSLGGYLTIRGAPNKGTSVEVFIPTSV